MARSVREAVRWTAATQCTATAKEADPREQNSVVAYVVEASVHAAVTKRWGERGVVELTGVIGYYTMVSMTLNAHEIPIPAGAKAPFSPATDRGLTMLPPGRMVEANEHPA